LIDIVPMLPSRMVVDDDLLSQFGPQLVLEDAADKIGCAARRERHDHPYRPLGITGGLRHSGKGRGCHKCCGKDKA
jgi:hypothetical protein